MGGIAGSSPLLGVTKGDAKSQLQTIRVSVQLVKRVVAHTVTGEKKGPQGLDLPDSRNRTWESIRRVGAKQPEGSGGKVALTAREGRWRAQSGVGGGRFFSDRGIKLVQAYQGVTRRMG